MKNNKVIHVSLAFGEKEIKVGRLAAANRLLYFEYDPSFINRGIEISPFKLPLKPGVITGPDFFDFLPGVFNDSLPDGWGKLLLDRKLREIGLEPSELTALDRLAFVGQNGMGALLYRPEHETLMPMKDRIDLDKYAANSLYLLKGEPAYLLDELRQMNGSSQGARPKIMVSVLDNLKKIFSGTNPHEKDFSHWLIKFPNSTDPSDMAQIEYGYSIMARKAGLFMTETHLFETKAGNYYFGTRRFDREGGARRHVHTACGLLNADFRVPALDYHDLLSACRVLTRNEKDVEKLFRLAAFNVLAHNRDDHSKNFAFIMNDEGSWELSPAYDLTFSSGPGGEQSTMVMGEGKAPGEKHLIELGERHSLSVSFIRCCIDQVKEGVASWPVIAKQLGIRTVLHF